MDENYKFVVGRMFEHFNYDTREMELRLPPEKVLRLQKECRHALNQRSLSARGMLHLLGKMTATILAVLEAPLRYRALQIATNVTLKSRNYEPSMALNANCRQDLQWWIEHLPHNNGRPLQNPTPQITIETDASTTG